MTDGYQYQLMSPLINGECPGSIMLDERANADPGAVVLDFAPKPGVHLWDDALGTVRELNGTETLARAKTAKRIELVAAADAAYEQEIPNFAGVVVAAKFVPPGNTQYMNARELTVFNRIQAGYAKVNTLLDQVDAATTVAGVQAITW